MRGRLSIRTVSGLFAVALTMVLVAACDVGPAHRGAGQTSDRGAGSTALQKPAAVVQFVGASVTHGLYASAGEHAYPSDVVAALRGRGVNVRPRVLAIPGATVGQALKWKIGRPANVVVVHMSSNNFVANTPLEQFEPPYAALIGALRKASPKADLVCLGEWHHPLIYNRNGNTPEDFDRVIADVCAKNGGTFEPLEQVYAVSSYHGPLGHRTPFGRADLHHPNDAGAAAIAQVVLQGLQQQPPLSATY